MASRKQVFRDFSAVKKFASSYLTFVAPKLIFAEKAVEQTAFFIFKP
jgi:hypothetical protein